jgi:hypothetical protein
VERLKEIPIDVAGEIRTETKHGKTPLMTGVAPGNEPRANSTPTSRTSQRLYRAKAT